MNTAPRYGSFLGAPQWLDMAALPSGFADFAFLGVPYGVPYDMQGVAPRAAAAPEAVRAASDWFTNELHHYDFDVDGPLFPDGKEWRIADCGDVPGDPRDLPGNAARATAAVRAILQAGAVPLVVGGDHAIPPLVVAAYEDRGPLTVVDVDAHLDFRDELSGVRGGYSSPMRRLREMPWVRDIYEIGLRGAGSARPADVEAARAAGNVLVKADEVHRQGIEHVVEALPSGDARFYVTVDVDGLDPSVMPGTPWPLPGGLTFIQVAGLLRGVAARGQIVGIDVCEFAPSFDVNRLTALTIVRLLMNVMGVSARRAAS
jgi:agmatinase